MAPVDMEPATRPLVALIDGVSDSMLGGPTPDAGYTLGDLLDHVGSFAVAFTSAARKDVEAGSSPPPDASPLGEGWRGRIQRDLAGLAEAWRDPAAWTGMTRVGGFDLPGEVAGLVALDEAVVHGWDVARASGQAYDCDRDQLQAVHDYLAALTEPEQRPMRDQMFGPVVAVPWDAPLLDRVIALSGRDPAWSPQA